MYRDSDVTVRVRVQTYRHGVSVSDPACPGRSVTLIADDPATHTDSVSRFYRFLADHRQSSAPILATITGRLVNGTEGGFVLKRGKVFRLASVSGFSEGAGPKSP